MKIPHPPKCSCGCGFPVKRSAVPPYDWNTFITGHNNRNRERKQRGKNYPDKPCAECGKEFKPRRFDSRYCSLRCQKVCIGKRQYLRKHGKLPDKERCCGICEKPFPRVDIYDWKRKYCSDDCSREAVKRSRREFYKRNPTARAEFKRSENPAGNSQVNRYFIRYPDVPRCCAVCGESRVIDLHHKKHRNGAPVRAKNTQKDDVWVLCPNHHAMIHRGIATPEQLGLK